MWELKLLEENKAVYLCDLTLGNRRLRKTTHDVE